MAEWRLNPEVGFPGSVGEVKTKRPRLEFVLFPLFVVGGSCCVAATTDSTFTERTVTVDGRPYAYRVFVPRQWTPDRAWPVILFLHGAGERGGDNVAHTRVGLPRILRRRPQFQAVVVMPQCPRSTWWGDPTVEKRVFAALEDAISVYRGDPRRIYLTGLSLGGYGTWAFGYKYPERFAALVPVCGGVQARSRIPPPPWHPAARPTGDIYALTAQRIGTTPVWAFHGEDDGTIPVTESRRLVEALRSAGGTVRYTEYDDVGHNSWDRAYSEPELWTWLLSQKRPGQ